MPKAKGSLLIDGRAVSISNPDKVLFPDGQITKAQVIDYYIRVAKYLLPHLKNRPITLKRYPDGVTGFHFYEKNAPKFTPDWVETFLTPRRERIGPDIRYILVNDLPTLVWLSNLANLEIHPFLHRAPRLDRPDWIVFDLDPGDGSNILTCVRVAILLREVFSKFNLESFPKVSGSKGLQVYVPLNTAVTYEQTGPFAKAVADYLSSEEPSLIVADMAKTLRRGKVLIDWSQNSDFKTTAAVYSLRAKAAQPYVSVPMRWSELEEALKKNDAPSLFFTIDQAMERLGRLGDIFSPVLTLKQKLPTRIAEHFGIKSELPHTNSKVEIRRPARKAGKKRSSTKTSQ